jgi:branched-chain amino acid transport system substrate-binding protein
MKSTTHIGMAGALGIAMLAVSAGVHAQATIRIGALATLEGPFLQLGQDGMRGVDLAMEEFKYSAGGKKIEVIKESSNAKPDVAVAKARKLIEQDKVDILIGPLSGSEGLAIKEYAKSVLTKTFVNGTSGAQDTTLRDPAPNFFRFSADGTQWQAGLGSYVYDVKKYRNIAIVADDYSYPYSQVMGFQLEFCPKGGKIAQKNWVPIGTKDYSSVIARLPQNIDAVYVLMGGADAINFLTQYHQSGGRAPLIGGTSTMDQTVLSAKGPFRNQIAGMVAASGVADENTDPKWIDFVKRYKAKFPDGLNSPSLFAHGYYVNTKATLLALDQAKGDLADGQKKFQAALAKLKFDSPTGPLSLDENRQAIANIYVTEVEQRANGELYQKIVKVAQGVNQTMGMPRDTFVAMGSPSRDNPVCK